MGDRARMADRLGSRSPRRRYKSTYPEEERRARISKVFKAWDIDQTGYISKQEFESIAHSKRKFIPNSECEQWEDSRNNALMKKLNADLETNGVSEEQFVDYFLTEWNAGLELFTDEDFNNALYTFLQVGMESKTGAYPATYKEAASVVFNAADLNCDGVLDATDLFKFIKDRPNLEKALMKNGAKLEDFYTHVWPHVDSNANTRVTIEEFSDFFQEFNDGFEKIMQERQREADQKRQTEEQRKADKRDATPIKGTPGGCAGRKTCTGCAIS